MYVCPYVRRQKNWKFLKILLGWLRGPGEARGRSGDTLWYLTEGVAARGCGLEGVWPRRGF